MASSVYFRKTEEDDTRVCYLFGRDPDTLHRTLYVDKDSHKMNPDDEKIDYMFTKTIGKINEMFEKSGEWPARGMSVS